MNYKKIYFWKIVLYINLENEQPSLGFFYIQYLFLEN